MLDMPAWLINLYNKLIQPRPGTGVVGKVAYVTAIGLIVLGVGFWSLQGSNPGYTFMAFLLVVALLLVFIGGSYFYADVNPHQAILEGGDLTKVLTKMAAKDRLAALPPPTANVAPPQTTASGSGND
jgi:hypothetical protein